MYESSDGTRRSRKQNNVLVPLEKLATRPAVTSRLRRGDLHVHVRVYEIATGAAFAHHSVGAEFAAVAGVHEPDARSAAGRHESGI